LKTAAVGHRPKFQWNMNDFRGPLSHKEN
jgi:hypothetical protein